MGSEGAFAVECQHALTRIFEAHEASVEGLSKKIRLLLRENKRLKAGVDELKKQNGELFRKLQQMEAEKNFLEAWRKRDETT